MRGMDLADEVVMAGAWRAWVSHLSNYDLIAAVPRQSTGWIVERGSV
jgi:hypothetical protein